MTTNFPAGTSVAYNSNGSITATPPSGTPTTFPVGTTIVYAPDGGMTLTFNQPAPSGGGQEIEVLFISNEGAGFADRIRIPVGTTISQLLTQKRISDPSRYTIRVRRCGDSASITEANYVLAADDKISVTPRKVEGANR